jgi:hypothetical protein
MDENNLINLLKKSLENFYDRKDVYNKYINDSNTTFDRIKNEVVFNDKNITFKYNILGLFDNSTNIWMWGWMMPSLYANENNLIYELLQYGLKILPTPNNALNTGQLFLKTQLVNSRFLLYQKHQLNLHLALACYLLKNKFKFLYTIKPKLSENKYITVYYMIF